MCLFLNKACVILLHCVLILVTLSFSNTHCILQGVDKACDFKLDLYRKPVKIQWLCYDVCCFVGKVWVDMSP